MKNVFGLLFAFPIILIIGFLTVVFTNMGMTFGYNSLALMLFAFTTSLSGWGITLSFTKNKEKIGLGVCLLIGLTSSDWILVPVNIHILAYILASSPKLRNT